MSERRYRLKDPHGGELGPATESEVCGLIALGHIGLDASASDNGLDFFPITHFPLFAQALEERLGVTGGAPGSDSTPRSPASPVPVGVRLRRPLDLAETEVQGSADEESAPRTAQSLPPFTDEVQDTHAGPAPLDANDGHTTVDRKSPVLVIRGAPLEDAESATREADTPLELSAQQVAPADQTPVSADGMPAMDRTIVTAEPPEHEPSTPVTQSAVSRPMPPVGDGPRVVRERVARPRGASAPADAPGAPRPAAEPLRDPASEPHTPMEMPGVPVRLKLDAQASHTHAEVYDPAHRRPLLAALGAWALLFVVLFGAGIVADLGQGEARYFAGSGFFYVRVLLLLSLGAGLSAIFLRGERLSPESFSLSVSWALLASIFGVLAGLLLPQPDVRSPLFIALSITFLHAVAEETFFRGFVDRALGRAFRGDLLPTVVGAAMYGLYHLTYAAMWIGKSPLETWLWSLGVILMLGVPFSLLYHMSKSFAVPLLCHLAVNFALILGSGR